MNRKGAAPLSVREPCPRPRIALSHRFRGCIRTGASVWLFPTKLVVQWSTSLTVIHVIISVMSIRATPFVFRAAGARSGSEGAAGMRGMAILITHNHDHENSNSNSKHARSIGNEQKCERQCTPGSGSRLLVVPRGGGAFGDTRPGREAAPGWSGKVVMMIMMSLMSVLKMMTMSTGVLFGKFR